MRKDNEKLVILMTRIIQLQMRGFQTDIVPDVGGFFRITIYRYVRNGAEAIRMTVFTAFADFPQAYDYITEEIERIIERFLTRDDIAETTRWIRDEDIMDIVHAHNGRMEKALAAEITEKELEKLR